jgi:putative ABC transport system permease protein
MLKAHLKLAWRNLRKHKIFSFINIFGLALGIAASLLIFQYARFELSYDRFEAKAGRIFRMQLDRYNEGKVSTQWARGAAGIGLAMKEAFPEVESYAKLHQSDAVISYGDQQFREERMYFANDAFLPMFSYRAVEGNTEGALKEVNTAVVTTATARKYFGTEHALGKVIRFNDKTNFKITAVIPDLPPNTHLKFDILLSFATYIKMTSPDAETAWSWDGFFTYVLLRPGTDPASLEKKIGSLVQTKWGAEMKEHSEGMVFHLQPLTDIHLHSSYMYEAETNGDGRSVYFLLTIAIFIIVIAWINYINLSTARSIDRAKEVGIRKVLGSLRIQLIRQFLFESLLVNLLAVALAFALVLACLPLFNSITGKAIGFTMLKDPSFWMALSALFGAGTILSGLYPAFVLSSFRPISVLKGKLSGTGHGAFLRQSLVVIQFTASVILIVGTFAVYRQLRFMQRQDLGVQIAQTLILRGPKVTDSTYNDKFNAFKSRILQLSGVTGMTSSTEVPGNKVGWNAGGIHLAGSAATKSNQYRVIGIDYDFLDTYGLKILKGRNFSRQFATDPGAVLFNEAAVKLLGFTKPEDALNKQIEFWGNQYTIIGVVSNHHQEALRQAYDAHIFRLIPGATNFYSLKLSANRDGWAAVVQGAEKQWASFFPGNPFDYFYLDDHYAAQYKADQQFGQTFGLFALLAIVVSCMGLLGLASFVTTQRTREIGIRKIVGAQVSSILLLLTKGFIRPVFVSFLIATPVAYYLLQKWLESYAFRITLNPWMFVLPALLVLVVAILTISTQTMKAASANPAKSLRAE